MDPIKKVSLYYTQLTKSEKATCDKIISEPFVIIENSILDAANYFNVSSSSISRLCKKLGYKGYSELRYTLSEYYKPHNDLISIKKESKYSNIINNYQSSFELLKATTYDTQIKTLVKYMHSKKTYALGLGLSSLPAKLLSHELYVEKQWIDCIDDNVRMNLLHHIADENSLFIIFSVIAGILKLLIQRVINWKNRNSKVVLITSNPDTPFLPYVDISFILPSTTPIPIENTHSFHYLNNIPIYSAFVEFIIYIYIQTQ